MTVVDLNLSDIFASSVEFQEIETTFEKYKDLRNIKVAEFIDPVRWKEVPANLDGLELDSLVKRDRIIVFKDIIQHIDFLRDFLDLNNFQDNFLLLGQTKIRIQRYQQVSRLCLQKCEVF